MSNCNGNCNEKLTKYVGQELGPLPLHSPWQGTFLDPSGTLLDPPPRAIVGATTVLAPEPLAGFSFTGIPTLDAVRLLARLFSGGKAGQSFAEQLGTGVGQGAAAIGSGVRTAIILVTIAGIAYLFLSHPPRAMKRA